MIDMIENKIIVNNGSSIVLYTTDDGNTQIEVKVVVYLINKDNQ